MPKPIDLSTENFKDLVDQGCLLVDKTAIWLPAIINEESDSILITRPRRWGKSINLSMLWHFLTIEHAEQHSALFANFAIAATHYDVFRAQHQGQYPVIFLNFKDINSGNYAGVLYKFSQLLTTLYEKHSYLSQSVKLTPRQRKYIEKYLSGEELREGDIEAGIVFLTECLHQHHGKKVWLLIDEYDRPFNAAHKTDFFDNVFGLIGGMLSAALKGNEHLHKAVLTGVYRMAKAGIASGLNNTVEYAVTDAKYANAFGFTEDEVASVFVAQGLAHEVERIKAWYNGYNIGNVTIYNPWSIMSCLTKQGELAPYWLDTANNQFIEESLLHASSDVKSQLAELLSGNAIEVYIHNHVSIEVLAEGDAALWSIFLASGYLTVMSQPEHDMAQDLYRCQVRVPNNEILSLYSGYTQRWLKKIIGGESHYRTLLDTLTREGDVEKFAKQLGDFLLQSVSSHDVKDNVLEAFYHGFSLGMLAGLRDHYHVYSNKESGLGRYDVMLIPRAANRNTGIILEFKSVRKRKWPGDVDNIKAAQDALQQISTNHYDAELQQHLHVTKVLKVGLAFQEKDVVAASQLTDLSGKVLGGINYSQEQEDVDLAGGAQRDSDGERSPQRRRLESSTTAAARSPHAFQGAFFPQMPIQDPLSMQPPAATSPPPSSSTLHRSATPPPS